MAEDSLFCLEPYIEGSVQYTDFCLLACSLHYRMYLRGLSDYALIQNVTFFATDGPDQSGIPRLILSKAFGLPNGPGNPTGGFGVPQNRSSTWVLTT